MSDRLRWPTTTLTSSYSFAGYWRAISTIGELIVHSRRHPSKALKANKVQSISIMDRAPLQVDGGNFELFALRSSREVAHHPVNTIQCHLVFTIHSVWCLYYPVLSIEFGNHYPVYYWSDLPFGLDGGKAVRGFALLFLALLRGTSRMEPVGKLPFTARMKASSEESSKRKFGKKVRN